MRKKRFTMYWLFSGWQRIKLGFELDLTMTNIKIYLLCGYVKIGYCEMLDMDTINEAIEKMVKQENKQ